jgi:hypothetical protein
MSISPSEFVPYSEIPAEFRAQSAAIEAVIEAESLLGLLDPLEGESIWDTLMRVSY